MMMDRSRGRAPARQEFDQFVAGAAEGLLRAAYLITWDLADAEDLVQDCLFKVARRWPRVRKMEHPTAYARTVLVHLALDEGKHRTRRRFELAEASAGALEHHEDDAAVRVFGRVEASADLVRALGALPPRQRVALVLRYFEDLSEADVAETMGCSVGTVKSTTSRALERLRTVVDVPASTTNGNGPNLSKGPDPASTTATTTTTTAATTTNTNDHRKTSVETHEMRTSEGSITA